MKHVTLEGVVQQPQSEELHMDGLRERLDDILHTESADDRLEALEDLISTCAKPLEAEVDMSPEYEAFLMALGRLHMLEAARARLSALRVAH